jgi:hypothetical protein
VTDLIHDEAEAEAEALTGPHRLHLIAGIRHTLYNQPMRDQ